MTQDYKALKRKAINELQWEGTKKASIVNEQNGDTEFEEIGSFQ